LPQTTLPVPVIVDRFHTAASPAVLFGKLPAEQNRFLLDSAGGPADIARWSLFGTQPFLVVKVRGTDCEITSDRGTTRCQMNPFDLVDELLEEFRMEPVAGMPPFCGGLAGYIAYDAGRCLERLPSTARTELPVPDLYLCAYDAAVAMDRLTGEVLVVASPVAGRGETALAHAREIAALLRKPGPPAPDHFGAVDLPAAISSNFTAEEYRRVVARAVEYIYAGDIFQVNLAQRFTAPLPFSPWELYLRLRRINPAPFAAFLDLDGFQVVSASPERFLQVEPVPGTGWRRVETRPIKGTRPRGNSEESDAALRLELEQSLKDRAELNMIVDLERNDLGRVCEFGTVRVLETRRMEAYPTVFHTVAIVEGHLRPATTTGQLLKATFPGGSITGAPKIRAMEIIEESEGLRRGVYCGSLGYLSFTGAADLSIVIRTMICYNKQVYFHAGGGIVADSEPEAEYEETLDKARALMNALLGRAGSTGPG
jgi:para-aminobenzoate synthetase component I